MTNDEKRKRYSEDPKVQEEYWVKWWREQINALEAENRREEWRRRIWPWYDGFPWYRRDISLRWYEHLLKFALTIFFLLLTLFVLSFCVEFWLS